MNVGCFYDNGDYYNKASSCKEYLDNTRCNNQLNGIERGILKYLLFFILF
jgi:hypothetical protein